MGINKIWVCFTIHSIIAIYHMGKSSMDDLENFINPEDLYMLSDVFSTTQNPPTSEMYGTGSSVRIKTSSLNLTESADCFGLGIMTSKLRWFFNLRPQHSDEIQVEFFMQNRKQKDRVQVLLDDDQFGLEWTFFDPDKTTIVIVHGFLSYSKASWVVNMTKAFLNWSDVNVITVDWSRGGSTWKYWRAVVNTRTVGSDLGRFIKHLMRATGAKTSNFHFVGHSLGAHICSFASNLLGGIRRITGLDPAQPCFITADLRMLLDKTDADFVDVIHTNGRALSKIGLGMPTSCGNQDFYPNGGMKQPGCHSGKSSFFNRLLPISKSKLKRALCNHGRAHQLFTESLKNHTCSLIGHKWNLSYASINASINAPCTNVTCAELGIKADKYPAQGSFYVVTTDKKPFCEIYPIILESRHFLINDLKQMEDEYTTKIITSTTPRIEVSTVKTKKGWFSFLG